VLSLRYPQEKKALTSTPPMIKIPIQQNNIQCLLGGLKKLVIFFKERLMLAPAIPIIPWVEGVRGMKCPLRVNPLLTQIIN